MYSTDLLGSTIVVLGNFNPRIFSPDWLEKNQLIGAADAEFARNSNDLILTAQVTRVHTEWFLLQVVEDQLILESKGVLTPNIKDLACGIFGILGHIPVTAMGLNFIAHHKIQEKELYHFIGDSLAPKDMWYEIFPEEDFHAGLETLVIKIEPASAMNEPQKIRDCKRVTVSHSKQLNQAIQFIFNNHFDVANRDTEGGTSAEVAAGIIDEEWQKTWEESTGAFKAILDSSVQKFNTQRGN